MTKSTHLDNHLSPYERAVAYYALPRVTSRVTLALIIAYCLCLAEVLAAITYGLLTHKEGWTRASLIGLAILIAFGIIIFLCRAFLNDVRKRRLLEAARDAPELPEEPSDTPDPFQKHVLLRRPMRLIDNVLGISDDLGGRAYTVQRDKSGRSWEVRGADGSEPLTVRQLRRSISFSFEARSTSWIAVYRGDEKIAEAKRRFSLMESSVVITAYAPEGPEIVARASGLYQNEILVGRTYQVRQHIYLDIREESLTDGLLGFFIAMV